MTALRAHIEGELGEWEQDFSADWRRFFDDTRPDFASIGPQFLYDAAFPMIPPRRGRPLDGAPAGAHIFRAFDDLSPDAVRVVVIGQDPYPSRARATGRAFEDGALTSWTGAVAASLKSLVQSALALRHDDPALGAPGSKWSHVRDRINNGDYPMEAIGPWFDRLQRQEGVLFVNAGWTLTRFQPGGSDEQRAHIAMWRPLMTRLLTDLAKRDRPVVFLLLGKFAQNLFAASGVEAAARTAGHWQTRVDRVDHPHPNAPGYFAAGNPLRRVNEKLAAMGGSSIAW